MIWRLIAQLTELMPQLMRLIPLLDRFNSNASAELIAGLQQGVGDLNDSHHSLVNQLKDQSLHMAAIEGKLEQQQLDNSRLRQQLEDLQQRYRSAETRLGLVLGLVALLVVVNLIALAAFFLVRR